MVKPQIDVLIPARNLTRDTATSIGNILSDNAPGELQVYVLLDGISNRTTETLIETFGESVHWIRGDSVAHGPAWARNRLADESDGSYLVFLDADVMIPPHFFSSIRERILQLNRGEVWSPRIAPHTHRNLSARFFSALILGPSIVGGNLVAPTALLAMRRETWMLTSGFQEKFASPGGEDWDWFVRNSSVIELEYAPDITVRHRNPIWMGALVARAWRYGRQSKQISKPSLIAKSPFVRGKINADVRVAQGTLWGLWTASSFQNSDYLIWRGRVLVGISKREIVGFIALLALFRFVYLVSSNLAAIAGSAPRER
jgi:glycosyltransferase involved in cell wall biosynthesis